MKKVLVFIRDNEVLGMYAKLILCMAVASGLVLLYPFGVAFLKHAGQWLLGSVIGTVQDVLNASKMDWVLVMLILIWQSLHRMNKTLNKLVK